MRGVIAVVVILFGAASARADSQADKLFIEGRELLKSGKAKEACEKFHAANALDQKAPAVLVNLGLCYEQLGKIATSLRWFRKAQTEASEATPRATDYENLAADKKAKLTSMVATVKINATGVPDTFEILVDGTRQGREELVSPVELDAGSHAIEARAPGKTSYVETVTVKDGDHIDAKPIPTSLKDAPKPPEPGDPARRRNGVLVAIGGGIVIGGVIATNIVFQSTDDNKNRTTLKNIQIYVLTPLTVIGAAGVLYGGYLLFTKGHASTEKRQAHVVPTFGPDGAGIAAFGRF